MLLSDLTDFDARARRAESAASVTRFHASTVAKMIEALPKHDGVLRAVLAEFRHHEDAVEIVHRHVDGVAEAVLRAAAMSLEAKAMQHDAAAGALRRALDAVLNPSTPAAAAAQKQEVA